MVIDASGSARVPMDASRHELPRLQLRLRLLLVFAFYLAAGKLGLSVPYTSGNISPLWPASGVALGSVLLWGFEVWPAIALVKDRADWGFEMLAEVERWFRNFEPVFPEARGSRLLKMEQQ